MAKARTGINLEGFDRLERKLDAPGGVTGEYRRMYEDWGFIYMNFTRKGFRRRSRGGGGWAKLNDRYKERKRSLKKSTNILVFTGDLQNALNLGRAGNEFKVLKRGIRVGYSNKKHPGSGLSYDKLASIHHDGNATRGLPARPIFVKPDRTTKNAMLKASKLRMTGMLKRSEIK